MEVMQTSAWLRCSTLEERKRVLIACVYHRGSPSVEHIELVQVSTETGVTDLKILGKRKRADQVDAPTRKPGVETKAR